MPVIRTKSQAARHSRAKGRRIEQELVRALQEAGLKAERVSRTGYPGPDVFVCDAWTAEMKARKTGEGFKQLERWKEGRDLLFLKRDRQPPMVVMDFDLFIGLARQYSSVVLGKKEAI